MTTLDAINEMINKVKDAREVSKKNNLKVSVFSLYIDFLSRIKYYVPYLPEKMVDKLLVKIKTNINSILDNHQLSVGLHSVTINNMEKEVNAILERSDLDYKVVENIDYNCLVRALKDRVIMELDNPKDKGIANDLCVLTEILIVTNDYTSETISALKNLLAKYTHYSAKSKHNDATLRSSMKRAIKAVRETIKTNEFKM